MSPREGLTGSRWTANPLTEDHKPFRERFLVQPRPGSFINIRELPCGYYARSVSIAIPLLRLGQMNSRNLYYDNSPPCSATPFPWASLHASTVRNRWEKYSTLVTLAIPRFANFTRFAELAMGYEIMHRDNLLTAYFSFRENAKKPVRWKESWFSWKPTTEECFT